jgi:hypothetical protein
MHTEPSEIVPPVTDPAEIEQAHIDAGDGVERTVTEARGGVRRGVSKIMAISTVLAVVAIGAVWLLASRPKTPPMSAQTPTPASSPQSNALNSQAWDQGHLGADGMKKCSAFRKVLRDSNEMRAAGRGPTSPSQRTQLEAELNTAKSMTPLSLTPFQCGVPLG